MAIPGRLKVDFSAARISLIEDGLSKLLSCFYDKCTVRQFVAVLLNEVQELYNACVDMEECRTLYMAQGVNLDALGRIVGQDRALWRYSEDGWMHSDIAGQGADQEKVWCKGGPLGTYVTPDDTIYRTAILARIVKNHTLVASVPEITALVDLLFGEGVSFWKCGPNAVSLIVPQDIDKTALYALTHSVSDLRVDDTYNVPYPATLSLCDKIYYIPPNPFHADRNAPFQCDNALCAVGAYISDMP